MGQLWLAQGAIVWLAYGLFEWAYGGSDCGGPDVQIPNCR
jgi:hypothetical protein